MKGKAEVSQLLGGMKDVKMVSSTRNHVIVEGDTAAVDGIVKCKGKEGKEFEMYYADFYELADGKVKKLSSYVIDKK